MADPERLGEAPSPHRSPEDGDLPKLVIILMQFDFPGKPEVLAVLDIAQGSTPVVLGSQVHLA